MKRWLPAAMLALAWVSSSASAEASCDSLASLRWLLGDWVADASKTAFHESWTEVAPHTFEGAGIERAKPDGSVKGGEVLRLVEIRRARSSTSRR